MTAVLMHRHELHIARKIWHMFTGIIGLLAYYASDISKMDLGIILVSFGTAALIFDIVRLKYRSLNEFTFKLFGRVMRSCEADSLSGLPFYALGSGLSLVFYYEPFAILSILFLIFADPVSSISGILYGTEKIYKSKSAEGSLGCFFTSFFLVMFYGLLYFPVNLNLFAFAFLSAIACSIIELFSTRLDDNLTIPVLTGGVMTILDLVIPMI
jgi:diacylglycerol kinase (CTP)